MLAMVEIARLSVKASHPVVFHATALTDLWAIALSIVGLRRDIHALRVVAKATLLLVVAGAGPAHWD